MLAMQPRIASVSIDRLARCPAAQCPTQTAANFDPRVPLLGALFSYPSTHKKWPIRSFRPFPGTYHDDQDGQSRRRVQCEVVVRRSAYGWAHQHLVSSPHFVINVLD